MFMESMYLAFTAAVKGQPSLFVAVGAGQPEWDDALPECDLAMRQLASEVGRKAVPPEAIAYLDENDAIVATPTPRLQVVATFGENEVVGTLREYGLFGGDAAVAANTGDLLAYYVHEQVEKRVGTTLVRRIVIDLTPRKVIPARPVTRYLGNVNTREVHDLDNETPQCQIGEIRRDRRYYFESVEAARAMGYDPCAFCFGPEHSER